MNKHPVFKYIVIVIIGFSLFVIGLYFWIVQVTGGRCGDIATCSCADLEASGLYSPSCNQTQEVYIRR